MQWNANRPFVPPGALDRLDRMRMRRAALRYAARGWLVTPGAHPNATGRFDCGRPGCSIMTGHPALEQWERAATTDPGRVHGWWRRRPYSVLLPTGYGFDAIEVPAAWGRRVAGAAGPVAVTGGAWLFLVRPGERLPSALEHRLDVVRHGVGSWIPAAPSRTPEGATRWIVAPERVGWRLPDAGETHRLLIDALGKVATPQLFVPRQLSTARRAS
jgi:hypothetical protein